MSGEITPIRPRRSATTAGAEVSTSGVIGAPPREVPPSPRVALEAAIEREMDALTQGVTALVARSYRKWGRPADRDAVAERAAEVLFEALKRAWERVETFDSARPARPWLLRFAVYVLSEQERVEWRHSRRRQDLEGHVPEDESPPEGAALLGRLYDLNAAGDLRLVELQGLVSPEEWRLISRAYIDRATREEMAAELCITPGALRVRLSRAARSFRAALQRADQFGAKDD